MKIKYLSVFLFFMAIKGYSQVGIGTRTPNGAALLHIENSDTSNLKGILIPKVTLDDLKSFTRFASAELPNGLLIYHESVDASDKIKEGFYYWTANQWSYLGGDEVNDFKVVNEGGVGAPQGGVNDNKKVIITTASGISFDIPVVDLNIVTHLKSLGAGVYVYTNEIGEEQRINVVHDVIQNIETIIKDEVVKNEVINIVKNDEVTNHIVTTILNEKTEALTGDAIITVENGSKSVLKPVRLAVNDRSIGVEKFRGIAADTGKVPVVSADGSVQYEESPAKIVEIALDASGSDMVITDVAGQTYSIPLSDINLLSTLINRGKGVYQYTNEAGGSTLVDIPQEVINNFEQIINNEEVINQINSALVENIQHVTNEIAKQGKAMKSDAENIFVVTGGSSAVLNAVELGVNDRSIGISKLKALPSDAGNIAVVDSDGSVKYKGNSAKIVSIGVSPDGKNLLITDASGSEFSVGIEQLNIISKMTDNGAGIFEYVDESGAALVIDIPGEVVSNIHEIITNQEVIKEIQQIIIENSENITEVVANEGKGFTGDSESIITVVGGGKAVLSPVHLEVNNRSIAIAKLKAEQSDAGKFVSVDATGQVTLVPLALDEKSITNFSVVENNGTTGSVDPSDHLTIVTKDNDKFSVAVEDLNILTRLEKVVKSGADVYVYTNEAGEQFIVDIAEDVINNIEQIFESQIVQDYFETKGDEITNYIRGGAADLSSGDKTIVIGGVDKGAKTVFSAVDLSLADGAVQTKHIANSAVTVEKLTSAVEGVNMETSQVLSADGSGKVAFNDVNTLIKKGNLSGDSAIIVTNGENSTLVDTAIKLKTGGVQTSHLGSHVVTVDKINSGGANAGQLLQSVGENGVAFVDSKEVVDGYMNGDLVGEDGTLTITNAEGRVFGEEPIEISVAEGGIKTNHLANQAVGTAQLANNAVTQGNIAANAVTADKLFAGAANNSNRVALADNTGHVSYAVLTSDNIMPTGVLKGDGIIGVSTADPESKVLFGEATLSVNSKSIGIDKLNSIVNTTNTGSELVLVSDGEGGVKFSPIDTITADGQDLTSDILEFSDGSGAFSDVRSGAVLEKTKIGIKDKSIDVTKLSSSQTGENLLLAADGNGGFTYVTIEAVQADSEDLILEDGLVFNDTQKGKKVVFIETKIGIGDKGIQGGKIADQAITSDKLFAGTATDTDVRVPMATADGMVSYQALKGSMLNEGEALATDGVITVSSVNNTALLSALTLGVKDEGIENKHIAENTITFSKIDAGQATPGNFVIVNDSSSITTTSPQALVQNLGKDLTIGSALSFTSGNGKNALLNAVGVDVKAGGITSDKIANQAVLPSKISSSGSNNGALLVADGLGATVFQDAKSIVQGQLTSDILGDTTIEVTNGTAVLAGDTAVTLGLKEGSVANKYIQGSTITSDKLTAGTGAQNRVAVADVDGNVTYAVLDSSHLTSSGDLTVQGGLTLTGNGVGATFSNVAIGVADLGIVEGKVANGAITQNKIAAKAIDASKMITNNLEDGKFLQATAGGASYTTINTKNISGAADLTVDNSLVVSGGVGSLLTKAEIKVNEGGIKREHIANQQITIDKLSSAILTSPNGMGVEAANMVMTTDGGGGVVYRVPIDLIDDYDITSLGSSINITNGTNAVLSDVNIDIKDSGVKNSHLQDNIVDNRVLANQAVKASNVSANAIHTGAIQDGAVTTGKLSSRGQNNINASTNTVLTADGNGKVVYQTVEAIMQKGDLGVGNALEIVSGNGKQSVLSDVSIDVKNQGIANEHLASNAVTTTKIAENTVSATKFLTSAADKDKILVADGNEGAAYQDIVSVLPKSPQFFFLPSVNLDVSVRETVVTKDLYQEYISQFGRPQAVSPGAPGFELISKDQFYYYITYYDARVFESVSVSAEGILSYTVKKGVAFTTATYMNIVLQVK